MNKTEKAINLFKYIKGLCIHKYPIVIDIKQQNWGRFFADFEKVDTIQLCNDDQDDTILRINKPKACPPPPEEILKWLEPGWDSLENDATVVLIKGNENFVDSKERTNAYRKWSIERAKYKKAENFFREFYEQYRELNRDSESVELMIGQGILNCTLEDGRKINHPIFLKQVGIRYEAKTNRIEIINTDKVSELYLSLLQMLPSIDHVAIKGIVAELEEADYHPLNHEDENVFLETLIHKLDANINFSDSKIVFGEKCVSNNPILFVRKRTTGIAQALDQIISNIDETGNISQSILSLLGENASQAEDFEENEDVNDNLSSLNGEDKDILLSKETNKEQLAIAKRIETYNAVLVQGPPGTGKTHTIANLMGHFLAQGKNILVTSYTKKALRVVKEKLAPELQNLCVSILDDNNQDMESSIEGITEYASMYRASDLRITGERLKVEREYLMCQLESVRKKIYQIKHLEYESVVIGGVGYAPKEMADFVYQNANLFENMIPGKVKQKHPLPVSMKDLQLLYSSNQEITKEDEQELLSNIPNPSILASPKQLIDICTRKEELEKKADVLKCKLINEFYIDETMLFCPDFVYNQKTWDILSAAIAETSKHFLDDSEWIKQVIADGNKGGGFIKSWERLIEIIEETYQFSGDNHLLLMGTEVTTPEISLNKEKILSILEEIKERVSSGKKAVPFSFVPNKDLKLVYHSILVNQKQVDSEQACEVAIASISLAIKRETMCRFWHDLIEKRSGPTFASLGIEPEQLAYSYIAKIKGYLLWSQKELVKIKKNAAACGVPDIFLIPPTTMIPIQEASFLITAIYKVLPMYANLIHIVYNALPQCTNTIQITKDTLEDFIEQSVYCRNLMKALENLEFREYSVVYEQLEKLFQKDIIFKQRQNILKKIEEVAPEWGNCIRNRINIHGKPQLPADLDKAWLWKQFSSIIDDILSQPIEKLQEESYILQKKLKQKTAELAETLAWMHLLERIEGDVTQKQALEGWRQLQRKMGKGTGQRVPKLRREAQLKMAQCQKSVPAWIMPMNKALESFNPADDHFDIVIVDEASQSDLSALAVLYLGKKVIIVGDDEQISPSAVGAEIMQQENLASTYKLSEIVPNALLYDMKTSLYDIAKTTFPPLMLKEHFRCVPSIIGFSNMLSYNFKIKPLRDESSGGIMPSTIAYRVDGKRADNKTNTIEAKTIVALMCACIKQPEYANMSFGAISLLGTEQAKKINQIASEKMNFEDLEKVKFLCGDSAQFQGDERDVIFLSIVDSVETGDGPLRKSTINSTKQRFNVAVSRARNQIWAIHSIGNIASSLQADDYRRKLLEYLQNPNSFEQTLEKIESKADSLFEVSVAASLIQEGYHIEQQWEAGAYKIDMVVIYKGDKIAIECDGEKYHSGEEKIREDMERQAILERLGWRFIRIRGSEYFRNPKATIQRVIQKLHEYGIDKEESMQKTKTTFSEGELFNRVKLEASKLLESWK